MGRLAQWVVIEADVAVRRMSHDQKVHLADEIYAQQSNMLASILALPGMGVDMVQLEVALHVLFVTFQATFTGTKDLAALSAAAAELKKQARYLTDEHHAALVEVYRSRRESLVAEAAPAL